MCPWGIGSGDWGEGSIKSPTPPLKTHMLHLLSSAWKQTHLPSQFVSSQTPEHTFASCSVCFGCQMEV